MLRLLECFIAPLMLVAVSVLFFGSLYLGDKYAERKQKRIDHGLEKGDSDRGY